MLHISYSKNNTSDTMATDSTKDVVFDLAIKLTEKYIEIHSVKVDGIGDVLTKLYKAVYNLKRVTDLEYSKGLFPAVPIDESVTDDYIICLEDGSKNKVLKQYLWRRYNMTVEEYKEKWNLPHDYPTVAPNSTLRRREIAKRIGLGLKNKL